MCPDQKRQTKGRSGDWCLLRLTAFVAHRKYFPLSFYYIELLLGIWKAGTQNVIILKLKFQLRVVAHTWNPSTWEVVAGWWIQGQLAVHSKILFPKQQQQQQNPQAKTPNKIKVFLLFLVDHLFFSENTFIFSWIPLTPLSSFLSSNYSNLINIISIL